MKVIKWTVAERKAIRISRNHWKRDMVAKFEAGDKAEGKGMLWWKKSQRSMDIAEEDCALCVAYRDSSCLGCPLPRVYGKTCLQGGSYYQKFIEHPSLRTAKAMMNSLDRMLKAEGK